MPSLLCDSFQWANGDQQAVAEALTYGSSAWECEEIAYIKPRIKSHHLQLQEHQCCYCRRSFHGEFTYVIDVEHVLPKRKFPELTFEMANLSVSCKRCNMQIKGQKIDFVTDYTAVRVNHRDRTLYKFTHPNLDIYEDHIFRLECAAGSRKIVKYIVRKESHKGAYTYDYFRLQELEIASFDRIQVDELPALDPVEEIRREQLAAALNASVQAIAAAKNAS